MIVLFRWLRDNATSSCSIKWKRFPRYWPFVWGIHRSPVNSSHKGQWRGALIFSLICVWINGWVNNREAGDLRRYRAHYDVTVMKSHSTLSSILQSHSNRHGCWCSGAYLAPGHLQQLYWMANTSLQWRHSAMASQITIISTVCSAVLFRCRSKKISKLRVNGRHKGPVTRKMFPFDDVIMGLLICIPCMIIYHHFFLFCGIRGPSH